MKFDSAAIRSYLTVSSGVFGRLVIALVYFLIVANSLTLGDFGRFAAASAVGLVLSRLLAFGFISPVYRVATVKPRLLGVYWAGLLALGALSLPVITLIACAVRQMLPGESIALSPFLAIVAAEVMAWRTVEWVVITLNGLGRFGRAATLVILTSTIRTLAAIAFLMSPWRDLDTWVWFYLASNAASLCIALVWFLPALRLRLRLALYPRRMSDALGAAGGELMFYAQGELDKLLVLAQAGDHAAGIYAIAMRIIDLTATPIRSFNQLLVQQLMADRSRRLALGRMALFEGGIAVVSTLGLVAFIVLLQLFPNALGGNVARIAPLLPLMLAVPALRNLIEYHGDLLYGRDMAVRRFFLLAALTALKLGLMMALFTSGGGPEAWAAPLNGVYLLLYAFSLAALFFSFRRGAS